MVGTAWRKREGVVGTKAGAAWRERLVGVNTGEEGRSSPSCGFSGVGKGRKKTGMWKIGWGRVVGEGTQVVQAGSEVRELYRGEKSGPDVKAEGWEKGVEEKRPTGGSRRLKPKVANATGGRRVWGEKPVGGRGCNRTEEGVTWGGNKTRYRAADKVGREEGRKAVDGGRREGGSGAHGREVKREV